MNKVILIFIVTIHVVVVVLMGISLFVLPFVTNIFVAAPLMVTIVRIGTSREQCILTTMENIYRRKLKMRRIHGFIGHYFIKPLRGGK